MKYEVLYEEYTRLLPENQRQVKTINAVGYGMCHIDLSNAISVETLLLDDNNFAEEELDLSTLTNLKLLSVNNCQLQTLNLQNNTSLEKLICYDNKLTHLDLSAQHNIIYVNANDNKLEDIKLGENDNIKELYLFNNQLKNIPNINKYQKLVYLDLAQNLFENLTLELPNLQFLWIFKNNLTSLDITKCPLLKVLYVVYNNLKELNLDNNLLLEELYTTDNEGLQVNIECLKNLQNYCIY